MGKVTTLKLSEDDTSPILARFIEVDSIELADAAGSWIQAFPYVEYDHPIHGKIKMDRERAERMAANVGANVRGQDLDIDYDHKALRGDAAGWVKKAEARDDGLYIFVEWTKEALTKLKEKAYRYFSPEYVDKWKHPDGRVFRDVLFGGALTNRPFLKGILPINLSEMVGEYDPSQSGEGSEGGNQVNREQLEQLANNLGVEFTDEMSDEDLFAAIAEASVEEPEEESEDEDIEEEEDEPELVSASEAELRKLAETNPAIAVLLADRERDQKRLAALEVANRLSEINIKLTDVGDANHTIAPKYRDKLRKLAVKLSDTNVDALFDLINGIVKDGIVELNERGGSNPKGRRSSSEDVGADFDELVKSLQESDDTLSFSEAVEEAARQNPELFEEYRRSSYANEELN
jgi:phage I-like protein